MAVQIKVGSFAKNTGTGDQSITGVGFQPQMILLSRTTCLTAGTKGEAGFWFLSHGRGATTATASYFFSDYNTASHSGSNVFRDEKIDFDSTVTMDSDGFTINWGFTSSAQLCQYVAIAGVESITSGTGTNETSVTHGSGGTPDVIIFGGANTTDLAALGAGTGFGFATRDLKQWSCGWSIQDGAATTATHYHASSSYGLVVPQPGFDGLRTMEVTGVGATAFTLTHSIPSGTQPFWWVALRGIGAEIASSAIGGSSIAGSSNLVPLCAFGLSMCSADGGGGSASTKGSSNGNMFFTDGTNTRLNQTHDDDALAESDNFSVMYTDGKILRKSTRTALHTWTDDVTVTLSSLAAGPTLNYSQSGTDTTSVIGVLFLGGGSGLSETVGATDTTVRAVGVAKTTSDTVEVTDAAATATITAKGTSDTVTVTDPSAVDVYRRTHELSETVTVTETLALGTGGPQISGALPGPKPVRYWDFDDLDDLRQALIDIDTWGSKATQLFPLRWEDVQADVRQGDFTSALTYEAYRDTPYIVGFMRWDQADELHLRFEMPNRWKPNTEVQVHIHVIPMVDPSSSPQVVSFSGQYAWGHVNSELVANASWTSFSKTFNVSTGDAFKEERIQLFTTTPSGSSGESILHVYLKRDGAAAPGGTDTYETSKASGTAQANLAIVSIDAHYQTDRRGSTE